MRMNQGFGSILTGLMENRALTVKIVSIASGRAYSTINQLVLDRIPPTVEIVRDIAPVLQIPLVDLLVIAEIPVETPVASLPPYPQGSGVSQLIESASTLTTEQLRRLADFARSLQTQDQQLPE